MVLQMEDCMDTLKLLHPQYDFFLFLFGKQREDGLNIENMSKSYGGKQDTI